jgi:hypothetical protein
MFVQIIYFTHMNHSITISGWCPNIKPWIPGRQIGSIQPVP